MSQQHQHDRRIDYIEFPATDIQTTKRYYEQAFGWEFTDYGPDYTSFADGRLGGGLRKVDSNTTGGPLVVIYAVDLEKTQQAVIEAFVSGHDRGDESERLEQGVRQLLANALVRQV